MATKRGITPLSCRRDGTANLQTVAAAIEFARKMDDVSQEEVTASMPVTWKMADATSMTMPAAEFVSARYEDFGQDDDSVRSKPNSRYAPDGKRKVWADDVSDAARAQMKFNTLDDTVQRESYLGPYEVTADNWPKSPAIAVYGRKRNAATGLEIIVKGPGELGRLGPNKAADALVMQKTACGMYRLVLIKRKDTGEWAFPGGMVNPNEAYLMAAFREFLEEAGGADEDASVECGKKRLPKWVVGMFADPTVIAKTVVNDPRNTDNAWMETVYCVYVVPEGHSIESLLRSGSDAADVVLAHVFCGPGETPKVIVRNNEVKLYASHGEQLYAACRAADSN